MLLVSMCLIYIHTFCLLTSIYMLLNYACATDVFYLLWYFSFGFKFQEKIFKYECFLEILCACFVLLFVYAYSYVRFKSSLYLVL